MMTHLNYKHLGYFRAVAHADNLTRAAEALNVSQSALSIQIKKLEEQLGHQLFERKAGRLHLTEAGRIALDHADSIFQSGDELIATLSAGTSARPTLRVGASATLSRNFQIGLIRQVLDIGDAAIILRSGAVESLIDELQLLNLDMVLLNAAAISNASEALRFHKLNEERVSLIGTATRMGPRKQRFEHVVAREPLIVPSASSPIRIGFDALVQTLGLTPRIVAEADDMAMLRLLIRDDLGVGVIPPIVVRDELESGRLKEGATLPGVVETFFAATLDRRFPNPLLAAVLG